MTISELYLLDYISTTMTLVVGWVNTCSPATSYWYWQTWNSF